MSGLHVCPVCYSDEHLSVEWCPEVWIDETTGVRVLSPRWHDSAYSTSDAYDVTQTCDELRDGDLIVCEHEGERLIAVLVQAWPTRVSGPLGSGMHELSDEYDWSTLDEGKYVRSIEAHARFVSTHTHTSTKESN
jgi:hypothetical protein